MNSNRLQYPAVSRQRDLPRHERRNLHFADNDSSTSEVPTEAIAVFLVNGDEAHRVSLETLVRCRSWHTECFASEQEFLESAPHPGPSCLLLSADLRRSNFELQRRVLAKRMGMPTILIAGDADVPLAIQAMKAGAMDFFTKPVCQDGLLCAIDDALARSLDVVKRITSTRTIRARHSELSCREKEVMSLVVRGLPNKHVGAVLGISEVTVKAHRGKAMQKMGARSLPDLVNLAITLSRIDGPAAARELNGVVWKTNRDLHD